MGHFNGDNAHSPPDTQNSRWFQSSFPTTATWLSLNYGEHNPSHVRRHALPFSTFTSLHFFTIFTTFLRVLQRKKQTQFSMLQIKTILKTHFDYRHLTSSSSSLYYPTSFSERPYKLSEETTQCKHTHIRYNQSSHITNFSSPKTRSKNLMLNSIWGKTSESNYISDMKENIVQIMSYFLTETEI